MALFQVTTSFVVNTRIKSAEVNQNFTDLLNIAKGHHHDPNIYSQASPITNSGIAVNAQILDTQLKSQITRSGLVNQSALGQITSPGIIARSALSVPIPFGGTGGDAALSISSGTTTINLGNAAVYVLNYTSISITGTGKLAFSNPNTNGTIIVLKSQGAVTLTSSDSAMIDASGMGAIGGVGVTAAGGGNFTDGNVGTDGVTTVSQWKTGGGGGGDAPTGSGGSAGAIITFQTTSTYYSAANISRLIKAKYPDVFVGAGGGSGGAVTVSGGNGGSCTSGDGGRGGGALIIECAGIWTFTTGGISVAGATGSAGSGTGNRASAGGGGGGGGGYFLALYFVAAANTGTVTYTGGTGGAGYFNEAGGDIASNTGPGGGGGGSLTAGTQGQSASNQADSGGAGGDGTSLITQNTEFA